MSDVVNVIQRMADETEGFGGTLGVLAKDASTGEEIAINPDVIFPTASTFKTVLLYELHRQADAGKLDLSERIELTDSHRVPVSGVMQEMENGAMLTVRDIATLMIIVSDNTATDIIYNLLGTEAIQQCCADLGLTSTSLPFGTWGILAAMRNIRSDDSSVTYGDLKHKLKYEEAPDPCVAHSEDPAENDITTPRDMMRLHEIIDAGEGLSASSAEGVLDILKRQKQSERIPAHLPSQVVVAHKTGSINGVRNDMGIVYAPDGTKYFVMLFTKGGENGVASTRMVADISKVIYEHFVGPITSN